MDKDWEQYLEDCLAVGLSRGEAEGSWAWMQGNAQTLEDTGMPVDEDEEV